MTDKFKMHVTESKILSDEINNSFKINRIISVGLLMINLAIENKGFSIEFENHVKSILNQLSNLPSDTLISLDSFFSYLYISCSTSISYFHMTIDMTSSNLILLREFDDGSITSVVPLNDKYHIVTISKLDGCAKLDFVFTPSIDGYHKIEDVLKIFK